MIRKLFALLVIVGAVYAYPHETHDESTIVPKPNPVYPDKTRVDPERFPAFETEGDPIGVHKDPALVNKDPALVDKDPALVDKDPALVENKDPAEEKAPIPEENTLVPTEIPEDITGEADLKPDGDLKTDATFWPYYRSWYPRYRTYWHHYPVYRTYHYYSPRSYYWW